MLGDIAGILLFAVFSAAMMYACLSVNTTQLPAVLRDKSPAVLVPVLFGVYLGAVILTYVSARNNKGKRRYARMWFDGDFQEKFSAMGYVLYRRVLALLAIGIAFLQLTFVALIAAYLGFSRNSELQPGASTAVSSWTTILTAALLSVVTLIFVVWQFDSGGMLAVMVFVGYDTTEIHGLSLARHRTFEQLRANKVAARIERSLPGIGRIYPSSHFGEIWKAYRTLADCLRRHSLESDQRVRAHLESLYWAGLAIVVNRDLLKTATTVNRMLSGQVDPPPLSNSVPLRVMGKVNGFLQGHSALVKSVAILAVSFLLLYTVGLSGLIDFARQLVLNAG